MDIKQNPFSVYDFLGYLIPGACFLYITVWLWPALGLELKYLPPWDENLFGHPDIYIPFIIAAYIVGHAISFLSSLFVERYAIWVFGYPSQFLLGRPAKGYFSSIPRDRFASRRKFIRAAFFVVGLPYSSTDWLLEKLVSGREIYAKALDGYIRTLIERKLWLFAGHEMGVFRLQSKVDPEFKGEMDMDGVDLFRAVYHYCLEKFPAHVSPLKNYVSMYGFLRTMAFLFTALFWLGTIKGIILATKWYLAQSAAEQLILSDKLLVAISLIAVAWITTSVFFMAFVKFYRRYTLEALMAFASNYCPDIPEGFDDPYARKLERPRSPPKDTSRARPSDSQSKGR
jgi:hypothetical protein